MNNNQDSTKVKSSVVTYSNIPLDDEPVVIGYDSIPKGFTAPVTQAPTKAEQTPAVKEPRKTEKVEKAEKAEKAVIAEEPVNAETISAPTSVEEPDSEQPALTTVIGVQFKKGGKVYYFDPGTLIVEAGEEVIIDTARGAEYGFCAEANHDVPNEKVIQPLRPVIRIASDHDKRTRAEYKAKEAEAFEICQNRILESKLDMKLVSAEYSFDGSKILFYFTADGRVDFRELVKDLASVFRTRIELRQIGVRDEAKMMGGLGICGRPFCCKQFLDDFQPVSIKMAKTQNLSLNPTKISGTCGRLMCCLKYEQEAYEDLIRNAPKQDSIVNTCEGKGTVTEVSLLKETVKVRMDSDPSSIKCFNNCDICILRNGKGKKNDPPIPDDIPPLPKPKKEEPEDYMAGYDASLLYGSTGTDTQVRSEQPRRSDRTERTERIERAERTERQERRRSDRTEKTEKTEKAEKPERIEKQEDGYQGRRARGRHHRGDSRRSGRSDRAETAEKAEKSEKKRKPDSERFAAASENGGAKTEGSKPKNHRRYYRGRRSGGNKSDQNK